MGEILTIRLDSDDVGQLLETGYCVRDDFMIEECRDAEEARAIAAHYDRIISSIEKQVAAQREK